MKQELDQIAPTISNNPFMKNDKRKKAPDVNTAVAQAAFENEIESSPVTVEDEIHEMKKNDLKRELNNVLKGIRRKDDNEVIDQVDFKYTAHTHIHRYTLYTHFQSIPISSKIMTLWLFQYADAETGDGDTSDIEDDESSSLGSCSSSSDITIDCDESHEANDDVTKITENEEEEISALWISPKAELLSTIFFLNYSKICLEICYI